MNKDLYQAWQKVVPALRRVLEQMDDKTLIAVGALPYQWIPLSQFLQHAHVYCVKNVADVALLRDYMPVTCLEEFNPKVGAKVQSTSYLLGNYLFQGFLKSRKFPFRLLLRQTTPPIVKTITNNHWEWVGNNPDSFSDVLLKAGFRDLLKKLNLPHLEEWRLPREEFLQQTFASLTAHWNSSVVIQRADVEVGGVDGTFFIHTEQNWHAAYQVLSKDERYKMVQISPFVKGHALSMLGCVTHMGTLSSPLQLQLIDVPEALGGAPATGTFMGHDWGYTSWPAETQTMAQQVVEAIGKHLVERGYRGIFGIDFMYDVRSSRLYPIECNPRPTGALPVFSLMTLRAGRVPPLEFFHLMTHLGIYEFFDFEQTNAALKTVRPVAHLSLSPRGIETMPLQLRPGIYTYQAGARRLHFERPGVLLSEMSSPEEFILIDSIPIKGAAISQSVPRLFKIIFNRSVAESSSQIDEHAAELVAALASAVRQAAV